MDNLQRLIDLVALENLQMRAEHWLLSDVLVLATLVQVAALALSVVLAAGVARLVLARLAPRAAVLLRAGGLVAALAGAAMAAVAPLLALAGVTLAALALSGLGQPAGVLRTTATLLLAWIVIRVLSRIIRSEAWSRLVALFVFAVAALSILDLLAPTVARLDQLGFNLGEARITLLDMVRSAVQIVVFVWLALTGARLIDARLARAEGVSPSLRVLTEKLARISLVTLALVIALTSAGIDLTAFALFTGAIGLGLGFGMQKPISNLISGLLLLVDRSIKPGDVLELSDPAARTGVQLFGWVTSLNARYVSLTTRDGTEWLVPNDELITQRIVNWSYHHRRLRLLTPINVSFDCDVALAMRLATEAAYATPRVLHDPAPVCRLMGFEDSTANLELRFWIDDPTSGIINVRSDVLLEVWRAYREHGIRTALGHRDLHLKPDSELSVTLSRRGAPASD